MSRLKKHVWLVAIGVAAVPLVVLFIIVWAQAKF